jgi:alpha-tubulin suppressor-like RCC1 family protein
MKKNYVVIMTLLISHNLISQCYSKISTKGFHNIAVRSDGSIWCWGNNEYNQIGNNIEKIKFKYNKKFHLLIINYLS